MTVQPPIDRRSAQADAKAAKARAKAMRPWYRKKRFWLLGAAALVAVIVAVAAASSGPKIQKAASSTSTTAPPSSGAPAATTTTTNRASTKVGQALIMTGSGGLNLDVTVTQLIDPATSDNQFETPDAGKRFVAVQVTFADKGSSTVQEDANNEMTILGSDSQIYSADFDSIQGCTNFNDGEYELTPGGTVTGCVNFQVPTAVKVGSVKFSPGILSDVVGTWTP